MLSRFCPMLCDGCGPGEVKQGSSKNVCFVLFAGRYSCTVQVVETLSSKRLIDISGVYTTRRLPSTVACGVAEGLRGRNLLGDYHNAGNKCYLGQALSRVSLCSVYTTMSPSVLLLRYVGSNCRYSVGGRRGPYLMRQRFYHLRSVLLRRVHRGSLSRLFFKWFMCSGGIPNVFFEPGLCCFDRIWGRSFVVGRYCKYAAYGDTSGPLRKFVHSLPIRASRRHIRNRDAGYNFNLRNIYYHLYSGKPYHVAPRTPENVYNTGTSAVIAQGFLETITSNDKYCVRVIRGATLGLGGATRVHNRLGKLGSLSRLTRLFNVASRSVCIGTRGITSSILTSLCGPRCMSTRLVRGVTCTPHVGH